MVDIKRKTPRFDVKFQILTEDIEGKGINISQGGFGILTEKKIEIRKSIPFDAEINGFIFSEKTYSIKGKARLLYSKLTKKQRGLYYSGFKFIKLEEESKEKLYELLNDIRTFQKNPDNNLDNISLADFLYYPSNDLFYKAKIFNDIIEKIDRKRFQMLSYYMDSPSKSTSIFVDRKSKEKKEMVMFGSNNYLGLTTHPDVINASIEGVKKYGTGNGAGAMVGGTLSVHKQLEEELADFVGKESVMIFNSGYSTNVGTISGLLRPQDAVIIDQGSHASIYDGCSLSNAKTLIFSHNNVASLKRVLQRVKLKYDGMMIVVDGIYSTNGAIAPIPEIVKVAKKYECKVMVDEAHGFGILGTKGAGAAEYLNQTNNVDIIMGTMSKSLAGVGGFIASGKEVIEYLRYYARSYIFSTNIPPAVACTILKSLQIIRDDKSIRERLHHNINIFKSRLKELNILIGEPMAAVIPIFIPDQVLLLNISSKLFDRGVFHNVMGYPAVPKGGSLLRFGIMATHTEKELNYALNAIEEVANEENLFDYYKNLKENGIEQ